MTRREAEKRLRQVLAEASAEELEEIAATLENALSKSSPRGSAGEGRRTLVETSHRKVTYRLQEIRCGKPCHCADGESLHGPYWYGFWKTEQGARSVYIGKKLRRLTYAEAEARKAELAKEREGQRRTLEQQNH